MHVVSFNIPYPANYGGVIDVFYKVKALSRAGVKVHLHSFQYGRTRTRKLNEYCFKTHFYTRKPAWTSFHFRRPYIVQSRRDPELLQRLLEDDYPILFEGLHTCYFLDHPALKNRFKAVRLHNVEWEYYYRLGHATRSVWKRWYFHWESKRLKQYERILSHADLLLAISPADTGFYRQRFGQTHYLPVFHPFEKVDILPGRGKYALYHGNLSVPENEQAVLFLLQNVFTEVQFPVVIAGLSPTRRVRNAVYRTGHATLVENPNESKMQELIREAQIHLLPTFQQTGIKLKLINTLFNGRYCIVNPQMVENTGMEPLCLVARDADKMKQLLREFSFREFTKEEIRHRKEVLQQLFSNAKSARALIRLLTSGVRSANRSHTE